MNKVVPTILTMSALLFAAGCSSTGQRSSSHSGVSANHASYATQGQEVCSACGTGQRSVGHAHSNQAGNALRHSHSGAAGHGHNGYSTGYGYTTNAVVNAGRNTMINTGVNTGVGTAAASSGGAGMSSLVKIAGALLVGGLIYSAVKDDDDDSSSSVSCVSDPDPDKNTC